MLKKLTRRISAFFVAIIAVVFLFPTNTYAADPGNVALDLEKVPLTAVKLEKAVIAGLTANQKSACLSNSKTTPQNLYQCLQSKIPTQPVVYGPPTPTNLPKTDNIPLDIESTPMPPTTPFPIPVATPTPTPQESPTNQSYTPPAGSLSADTYFNMINNHRSTIGLPAFEKHPQLCEVAASRGPELNNEIFGNSYIHAGFRKLNLPFWATENMIGYPTEEIGFSWWMNSSIHRRAIESPDYKYACGTCSGKACAMLFTSFIAKQEIR